MGSDEERLRRHSTNNGMSITFCNLAPLLGEYYIMDKKLTDTDNNTPDKEVLKDANLKLGAGAGITSLAVFNIAQGIVCPVCLIAAPAFIGMGLWERHKAKKKACERTSEREEKIKK